MITIYGRATSSNVQLVMWMIGELGLEYERIDVGHKYGGTNTPEYLSMNPMGRVPVMCESHTDGEDLVMFESGAIARYLATRYGEPPFRPDDPVEHAALDMWAEWIKVTFASSFALPIFWPLLKHPRGQGVETVQAAADALKPLANILDARIGEGPWLAGETLTFADIWTGHLLFRYSVLNFDKAATPNIDAYYNRLTCRPAYAEHVMVDFESLRMV